MDFILEFADDSFWLDLFIGIISMINQLPQLGAYPTVCFMPSVGLLPSEGYFGFTHHISQAETGAMLMYYGGDVVDVLLFTIRCYGWYKSVSPRAFISKTGKAQIS